MSSTPSDMTPAIEFVPVGDVGADAVEAVAERSAAVLGYSYMVAGERLPLPEEAYDAGRRQYLARAIMEALHQRPSPWADYILGVADVDLYARGLNFVFGQAELHGQVAVISLRRLRPEYWQAGPDEELFLQRAVKEAVHELGHVIGLGHCDSPRCVMHFSNSLADTDRKGERPCPRCATRIR